MRFITILAAFAGAASWLSGPAAAQPVNDPAVFWNDATLYRDEYGTPHIHAGTVRAMAFAFGYAQAEDHLEPMLMAYRVAAGRAAEVGGEPFADSDAFSIKLTNAQLSAAAMAAADPLTRDLCEGFALGINAWILEHQTVAPQWAEGVQPKDVLAWWHYLMVTSAPFDLAGVYHPKRPLERANAWALAPSKTVDKKTMLVMSPYQYFDGPYRWYEAHLMVGNVNLAGATLFGLPVLLMGHNEHLGWALTPNGADTADFYREEVGGPPKNPSDPRLAASAIDDIAPLLSFMANAKPYYVRTAAGMEERAVPALVGARGPIFEGTDGGLYSWRNGAFGQFGGMRQLLLMGQSTDLATFKQALTLQQFPGFQILYADKAGNLSYTYNARLGNKNAALDYNNPQPIDWTQPVAPIRDNWAWSEIIPVAKLPQIDNPESGFLQACGTPPWLATNDSGLNPADWPQWLAPEPPNYRTFRVNQILSGGPFSFPDMGAMVYDTLVPAAVDMVPLLLHMASARPELVRGAHPDLVTALRLLRDWNFQADRDSQAMAYYNIWWTLMVKRHADEFVNEAGLYQALLANSYAAQGYALDAAVEAARIMRNDFNRLAIPWGELHRIQRGNRNEPMFGTSTGDSIFLSDNTTFVNRQWRANFGHGFAMAVHFGDETRSASVVPFGASENPASPHFADQMDLYLGRTMKRVRFQYDEMIGHAASGYGRRVILGAPGVKGYCAITLEHPQRVKLEEITDPPRPYPGGQVPFTPAIRPVLENLDTACAWELELFVPEDRCRPEHRSRLRLYTYTQQDGWNALIGQRFREAEGAYTGSGNGRVMIAVLGPHDLKLTPAPETDTPPEMALAEPAADAPKPEFLRAPEPTAPENAASEEAGRAPEAEGEATAEPGTTGEEAMTDEAPPLPDNPYFDVEFLDPQGPPPDGEQVEKDKKWKIFSPFRNKKKSEPKTNFNG